jgi:hypothetical protein
MDIGLDEKGRIRQIAPVASPMGLLTLAATLALLYFLSRANYLLFHSIVESFSIIVACGVFMVAWNSRRFHENGYFLCLGVGALCVAVVDFLHTLAYKDMGVFPGAGANLPTQLWIAARYLEAAAFLLAPLLLTRRARLAPLFCGFLAAAALLLAAVFGGLFPDCFREPSGLTPFKIASEYLICLMIGSSVVLLHRQRRAFDPGVLRLLFLAAGAFILAELSFTLYTDVFGVSNMVGHLFKVAGFYFIYRGVIETGLTRPYDLLFRELKQSEERYRGLYQKTPVMLHSIDQEGRLMSVSDYWLEHLGYARQEVIGHPVTDLFTETSRRYALERALPDFFRTGACQDLAYQVVKKDGEVIVVHLSATTERNEKGEFIRSLAVMVDVTERLRYEKEIEHLNAELLNRAEELEETNTELEAANENLDEANTELETANAALVELNEELATANGDLEAFNYSVSHDLRGPLTIITCQSQLILTLFAKNLEPEAREFIAGIQDQTCRMDEMITTLLDFSRLGKVELRRQRVDLSTLAKSIARELTLREQTRTVAFHIPEGLGTEGDLGLLQILLENLLGNAWKYTGKTAEPKIEVGLAEVGCGRTFFVRDNGAGFDPARTGELFAPFKRLHDADDFEGFGIGLATVQRIVKRHGGKVWAEGFPGEGATFYFSL